MGNPSYCAIGSTIADSSSIILYAVKVSIRNLNIREKPAANSKSMGYTDKNCVLW